MSSFGELHKIDKTPKAIHDVASLLSASIIECLKRGGKVFIYGNGGFASLSEHFAAEFIGRFKYEIPPMPVISLCGNTSLITCISNDYGFSKVFSRQLDAMLTDNDITIGLTTSAKSKNIYEALYATRRKNGCSWVITGNALNDVLSELCDNIISIESNISSEIQDYAHILLHAVSEITISEMKANNRCVFEQAVAFARNGINTLFLDRDGVINRLLPDEYVLDGKYIELTDAFTLYAKALADNFDNIIVVTNQKCVGKGLLTLEALDDIHRILLLKVIEIGGRIDDFFIGIGASDLDYKIKPNIGLSDEILKKYPLIDFHNTLMIGDSYSDYLFAKRLGVKFLLYP